MPGLTPVCSRRGVTHSPVSDAAPDDRTQALRDDTSLSTVGNAACGGTILDYVHEWSKPSPPLACRPAADDATLRVRSGKYLFIDRDSHDAF